jgi:hypothetical protein
MATETETALPTLHQAFESAEKEAAPDKETVKKSVETDTETDGLEKTQPEGTEAADQAEETAGQTTETTEESLLSPEEEKLTGKAREKALQRAFTKKTTVIAAERKELQRAQMLWDSFNEDPKGTIKFLAEQAGVTISEPDAKTTPAEPAKADTQPDPVTRLESELRTSLGSDLEFLADKFQPVFSYMRDLQSKLQSTKSEVQTITGQIGQSQARENIRRAGELIATFKSSHKDFDQVYPDMLKTMKRLTPAEDMSPEEYMDSVYHLATRGKLKVLAKKEAVAELQKAAQNAEPRARSASSSEVSAGTPGRLKDLKECFDEAERELA